jgi:hypothetical protein
VSRHSRKKRRGKKRGSHAAGRIRERVIPAHADLAFEILRDRESLVAWLGSKAAETPTRMALALAPGDMPPWLVVDREGQAVTCLAAGMSTTEMAVGHDAVLVFVEERRRVFRAQRALADAGDLDDPLGPIQRFVRAPHRAILRDFEILQGLAPFVAPFFAGITGEQVENLRTLRTGRHAHKRLKDPETAWRKYLCVALGLAAVGRAEGMLRANLLAAGQAGDSVLAATGIHNLAQNPQAILAFAERAPREAPGLVPALIRVCLPILGLLHPGYDRDVRQKMKALAKGPFAPHLDVLFHMMDRNRPEHARLIFLLVTHLPALFSRRCPPEVLNLAPEARSEVVARILGCVEEGGDLAAAAEVAGPWQARIIAEWGPFKKDPRPTMASLELWRSLFWDALFVAGGDTEREWLLPLLAAHAPAQTFSPPVEGQPAWSLAQGSAFMSGPLLALLRQSAIAEKGPRAPNA